MQNHEPQDLDHRLTVALPASVRRKLRLLAAFRNQSQTQCICHLITAELDRLCAEPDAQDLPLLRHAEDNHD